jgi:lysophospholipase L1-like esterase
MSVFFAEFMRTSSAMKMAVRGPNTLTERIGLAIIMVSTLAIFCVTPFSAAADTRWVDAWCASPDYAGPSFNAQTVRQIIRTSIGGSSVRIRLSNLFGTASVTIGPVHVAAHASGSAILAGTDHTVTFGGKSTITIAKGDAALSDPIALPVHALEELAVSMYLPDHTKTSTIHTTAYQTSYITLSGDATVTTVFPESEVSSSRFFLTDVEVSAGDEALTIVAVGDSITDGYGSTQDQNSRWPDALAVRLQADPGLAAIAIANSGISGNRILNDGAGPSALARFDRDAMGKPGVRWIILLEGINDIGAAAVATEAKDDVSAQQIIDGMKTLIRRAHQKDIKVMGATLTPFGGLDWPYHSAVTVAKRQAINVWIRTGGQFDAIVDFDQATRDPAHPDRFLPAYDSGDHLHPNGAGYKAMAAAINLQLFMPGR